jgi:CBS domain-containing protein/RimJ/RimL family protein N-acetyltransferase
VDDKVRTILINTETGYLPHAYIDRKRRPILFRKVTKKDYETILKMYRDFEPKESYQGLPPAEDERLQAWVKSMLENGFNIVGISFDHEAICHGAIFDIDGCRSDFILAVAPRYQNAGIGIQLTRLVKKISQEIGYKNIWLCVEPYNMKAKHIYSKVGFHYISRQICEECEMQVDLKTDPALEVSVENIMTRDVFYLREDQTAKDAIKMFLKLGISGLPVVNSGMRLVGFLTETDVLEGWTSERFLNEIMTRDVLYINEDSNVSQVVMLICDRGVKQIPVVQKGNNILAGIVSRKDILRHLFMRDFFY